ncbi:hypothetical protein BO86DRAFT_389695, partial [Aspergillus japonicus CBS 114.51]
MPVSPIPRKPTGFLFPPAEKAAARPFGPGSVPRPGDRKDIKTLVVKSKTRAVRYNTI